MLTKAIDSKRCISEETDSWNSYHTSLTPGSTLSQSEIKSRTCPTFPQRHKQSNRVPYLFSVALFSRFLSLEITPQLEADAKKGNTVANSKHKCVQQQQKCSISPSVPNRTLHLNRKTLVLEAEVSLISWLPNTLQQLVSRLRNQICLLVAVNLRRFLCCSPVTRVPWTPIPQMEVSKHKQPKFPSMSVFLKQYLKAGMAAGDMKDARIIIGDTQRSS